MAILQWLQRGSDGVWRRAGGGVGGGPIGVYDYTVNPYGTYGSYRPDPATNTVGIPYGTGALTPSTGGTLVVDDATATAGGIIYDKIEFQRLVKPTTAYPVKFTRSRFVGNSSQSSASGLLQCGPSLPSGSRNVKAYDCEFDPATASMWWDAMQSHDFEAHRCVVRNTVDGFGATNITGNLKANVGIYGCYVELHAYFSPDKDHAYSGTSVTATRVSGNTTLTLTTTGMATGQTIQGAGIPVNTTVVSISTGSLVMSIAATSSGTGLVAVGSEVPSKSHCDGVEWQGGADVDIVGNWFNGFNDPAVGEASFGPASINSAGGGPNNSVAPASTYNTSKGSVLASGYSNTYPGLQSNGSAVQIVNNTDQPCSNGNIDRNWFSGFTRHVRISSGTYAALGAITNNVSYRNQAFSGQTYNSGGSVTTSAFSGNVYDDGAAVSTSGDFV